jgi:hypothetical protein
VLSPRHLLRLLAPRERMRDNALDREYSLLKRVQSGARVGLI